jgi:signal transduction histidine kinase/CheY-like chemotaxis protein
MVQIMEEKKVIPAKKTGRLREMMKEADSRKRAALFVVEVFILIFVVITGIFMLLSNTHWLEDCESPMPKRLEANTGWERVYPDGHREAVTLPCSFDDVKAGEEIVFESTVPENITDKYCFSTRSDRMNMRIMVGDEVRFAFNQKFTYFYWTNVVSRYVYASVTREDIGKPIRVIGVAVSDIPRTFPYAYYSERGILNRSYMTAQGPAFVFAMFLVCLSISCVVLGVFLRVSTNGTVRVDYVGWILMMAAAYILTEGIFRDILFSNVIAMNAIPELMMILAPMMMVLYFDSLQEGRYRTMYLIYLYSAIAHGLVCVALALLRKRDLGEDFYQLLFFLFLSVALFAYGVIKDHKTGKSRNYSIVVWSSVIMLVLFACQLANYVKTSMMSAIYLESGLLIFTIAAIFNAFINLLKLEEQKRHVQYEADLKSKFLATMSHEIRTPINAILGMNEAILRESAEKNTLAYATDVEVAGKLLLSLINDILDFSKLDSGKMEILPVSYHIKDVVTACRNLVERRAVEKGLKFVVVFDENIPSVLKGDEVRIQQIITNVLTNAVKYTRKGRVGLKVTGENMTEDGIDLRIEVSDTGIGIKDEDKEKLFNVFTRVDEERNASIEGTGLGLAITGSLVKLMGGTINVTSSYGSGSVFTIVIPQHVVNTTPAGKLEEKVESEPAPGPGKRREDLFTAPEASLLAVDDVLVNLKVVQSLLKKTGMKIDTAISGKDCLELTKKNKYDIILLDHMMPGKDGIETLRDIKADVGNPNRETPVIVLTANAIIGAKEEYMKQGFTDYLSKPIALMDLEKMLLKYLPPDKIGGKAVEKTILENEKKLTAIEHEVNSPSPLDEKPSVEEVINRKAAMDNSHYNEQVWRERIETYLREDKRAMLAESYEKAKMENYKMIVRSIRSSSQTIGALELAKKAQEVEKAIEENNAEALGIRHKELSEQYSRAINVLTRI